METAAAVEIEQGAFGDIFLVISTAAWKTLLGFPQLPQARRRRSPSLLQQLTPGGWAKSKHQSGPNQVVKTSHAQGAFLCGSGNVVDMVSHKAVGPDSDTLFCTMLYQEPNIDTAIRVVEKSVLFSIAALSEVVGKTRNKIARSSSHEPSVNPGNEQSPPGIFKGPA